MVIIMAIKQCNKLIKKNFIDIYFKRGEYFHFI